MIKAADVIEALSGIRPEWASVSITGGVVDSRQAFAGCLFVALPGERYDGHDFVGQAFEKGAILAIVQRDLGEGFAMMDLRESGSRTIPSELDTPFCILVDDSLAGLQRVAKFWRKKLEIKVIGVTGSVGKSTTKELIAEVLSQRYKTLKNQGNLNNEIGLPLTLLSLDESHARAVLEMGFYVPGEIALLCDLAQPHIGVITNVGTVHAERAGSQAEIARGKSELVEALPSAPEGVAILNYDDPWVQEMGKQTRAEVFYYGLDPAADLWADHIEGLGLDGISFRLHFQNEVLHLRVPLIGRHSVHTALRASAVGLADGLTWEEIVSGLRSGRAQLRLVTARTPQGALLLDDTYNASPESVLAALNLLNELQGHKIAVLGDMLELGQYEQQGHEMVGVRAAEVVDSLITVGERGQMIANAAREAGLPALAIVEFEDVDRVVEHMKDRLEAGDIVLVKGSHGMRMDRIVAALEARS
jgi:UDP-N-acetylmuramoyl-tripeptide--D-alanyl-D-alanine ligase